MLPKNRALPPAVLLAAALAAELLLACALCAHGSFASPTDGRVFAACGAAAGVAYWIAVRAFAAASLSARQRTCILWLGAVLLRAVLLPSAPGDDFWRFLWEGKMQLHGFNPYQLTPDAPALAALRDGDWANVNHRDYAAIYPPAMELLFAGLARINAPLLAYKLLFATADLGVVAVLRRLLADSGLSPSTVAWYAWNPMAAYVCAGGAHFDSLMLLALAGSIWTLDRASREPGRNPWAAWTSALLLGTAIALKIVPVLLLPVWFFALGWRRAIVMLPVAAAMLPALAYAYGFPGINVFRTLKDFAYVARLNDALWWLSEATVWPNPTQKNGVYQLASFAVCGALALIFRHDWRRGLLWVLGAALLLSPVLHPWYVIWILPVAAWRGRAAGPWFVLSISLFGYFILRDLNRTPAPWFEPVWVRLVILVPPLAALAAGWNREHEGIADAANG